MVSAAASACFQVEQAELPGVQEYLATRGLDTPVEVETRTLEEVDEVVGLLDSTSPPRISRVMLDNMAHTPSASPGTQGSECQARRRVTGNGGVESSQFGVSGGRRSLVACCSGTAGVRLGVGFRE